MLHGAGHPFCSNLTRPLSIAATLAVFGLVACSSGERNNSPLPMPDDPIGMGGSSSSGDAGPGGAGGGAGAAGEADAGDAGGADGDVKGDAAGDDGSGGGEEDAGGEDDAGAGGGGDVNTGIPTYCREDLAYGPTFLAFGAPTPQPLAEALNELVYAKEAQAISVVLHETTGGPLGALSATVDGASGGTFVPNAPTLLPVIAEDGQGFTTKFPQATGIVRLYDLNGTVDLHLVNLRWSGVLQQSCNRIFMTVRALIPPSEKGVTLHTSQGVVAIADYVDDTQLDAGHGVDPGDASNELPKDAGIGDLGAATVSFTLEATPIDFDFTTL